MYLVNENSWFSIKISLTYVPYGLIDNNPVLVQIMAVTPSRRQAIILNNSMVVQFTEAAHAPLVCAF